MLSTSLHSFHIPVMGLAFTIDSPVKVAKYGINSVVSIIEDRLLESMRKHYYKETNRKYVPIDVRDHDYRAKRVTDYLNLINAIVNDQIDEMRRSPFVEGSESEKYFMMLPSGNPFRTAFQKLMRTKNPEERAALEKYLRAQIRPGRIDVNIMTKVDKDNYDNSGNLVSNSSDALAALRGYANSELTNSAIVFSAGLNPRLFNYLETLPAFHPTENGRFNKEVIVKVSDYRSALIQGKYLAKKGIWVSEFRVESGLNCGGHAFATGGTLLGPILQEFREKREELVKALFALYQPAAREKGIASPVFDEPFPVRITAQGGIGTYEEASFLTSTYDLDSTGWGSPFLLCPEATNVDDATLQRLCEARERDIQLSKASPLGVRFNYLIGTSAEKERLQRIAKGKPGSPCTEKHLVSNTEFTKEPICTASHSYQKQKIQQLQSLNLSPKEYEARYNDVVSKECLCVGLSNAAFLNYGLPTIKNLRAVTVCPGPNLAYFSNVVTLRRMTDHIYGRTNIIQEENRPHMFIKELRLNVEYLRGEVCDAFEMDNRKAKDLISFAENLLAGIDYYRDLTATIPFDPTQFENDLKDAEKKVRELISGILVTSSAK